jgi:hypothetical protein
MISRSNLTPLEYQVSSLTAKPGMVLAPKCTKFYSYVTYNCTCYFVWLCNFVSQPKERQGLTDFIVLSCYTNFVN